MSQIILLDTHIWFWWINLEHQRIPTTILTAIETALHVGIASISCFELALAHHRGRLKLPLPTQF